MSYYNNFSLLNFEQPYSLPAKEKNKIFLFLLNQLTEHHYNNSLSYKKIVSSISYDKYAKHITGIPFIPVRIFKMLDLMSVPKLEIFKTLTSSGTTGQIVSRIYLSRENSLMQVKILSSILSNFLGNKRLPMILIDEESVLRGRNHFNARSAGILGFSIFGRNHIFALDSQMHLKERELMDYININKDKDILLFGFTFVVWKYFYHNLVNLQKHINFGSGSILLHGGGWKKLNEESVSNATFKKKLLERTSIERIHNYYGMVEQTGSIFMECENGSLHTSDYSDIIVRDPINFNPMPFNKRGLIQVISLLPLSYPGHSLLTEDVGQILGEDDCPCGRMGKYFHVFGRIASAEARGCSDVRQY